MECVLSPDNATRYHVGGCCRGSFENCSLPPPQPLTLLLPPPPISCMFNSAPASFPSAQPATLPPPPCPRAHFLRSLVLISGVCCSHLSEAPQLVISSKALLPCCCLLYPAPSPSFTRIAAFHPAPPPKNCHDHINCLPGYETVPALLLVAAPPPQHTLTPRLICTAA